MTTQKKNAPQTASTVHSAKIIKIHPENTTKPAKRQVAGKIINFEEQRNKCPPRVKWFYDGLSATPLGQAFINALISAAGTEARP